MNIERKWNLFQRFWHTVHQGIFSAFSRYFSAPALCFRHRTWHWGYSIFPGHGRGETAWPLSNPTMTLNSSGPPRKTSYLLSITLLSRKAQPHYLLRHLEGETEHGAEPASLAISLPSTTDTSPLLPCSAHLEMRLTAALAVRGGKNSRENHLSPASCRRRILSRSRSCRSASRTGVEQRELSLELSLPLLLPPSDLELELALQVCWVSLTMVRAHDMHHRFAGRYF